LIDRSCGLRSSLVIAGLGIVAALPLGGCTDLRRALGMEKVIPDEYAVVSRAPLAIPPDYGLRPPRPGARPTQEPSMSDQARQTVFRAGDQQASLPGANASMSVGEEAFLKKAGAGTANPDIRDVVNQENTAGPEVEKSFVDSLVFWQKPKKPDIIDPQQESLRLKDLQKGGTAQASPPPTPAETPTIERKSSTSLIDRLF
jgi:hypothetical protein